MKKIIAMLLIIGLVLSTFGVCFAVGDDDDTSISLTSKLENLLDEIIDKFNDIRESDWFAKPIAKLLELDIVDGFGDGTFKPNNKIQVDQFIKMTTVALGYDDIEIGNDYWASPYIQKAKDLDLVKNGEFSDFKRDINRGEMARIIIRALEDEEYPKNMDEYKRGILDFDKIPKGFQNYVLKAYVKGIVAGYPDGTFKHDRVTTRAEASAILIRMIDKDERVEVKKPLDLSKYKDIKQIPLDSKARIKIYKKNSEDNSHNVDFRVLFLLDKPIKPQYKDAYNLLSYRFGEKKAEEILNYVKKKKHFSQELYTKYWTINDQKLRVGSYKQNQSISLVVWNYVWE